MARAATSVVDVENAGGRARVLLVCEHASNAIPEGFKGLGLSPAELLLHSAWDIGALRLARALSARLDAPLIAAPACRLLVDPNRAFDAHDLIPATAEGARVPGNENLSAAARQERIDLFHTPFHEAIEAFLDAHRSIGALVAVHSFTPTLFGKPRPWDVGILHDEDARIADPMLAALKREPGLTVGRNEPYAPDDGVYYTLTRHGRARSFAPMMIEVRNDLLSDEANVSRWAMRLSQALTEALDENNLAAGSSVFGSIQGVKRS